MTSRRRFLELAGASISGVSLQAQSSTGGARPNILIIMSDQHRAGLTRRTGFPLDTMPTLDRLAAGGCAFDRAYTTAPLCVPARVSLLTGRWPHAHRVRQNSVPKAAVFDRDLFQVTKSLGYRTGVIGKNHTYLTPAQVDVWRSYGHHNGYQPSPARKDYVEFDRWMGHLNHGTGMEPTPFPVEVQYPWRIVSDAIDFIDGSPQQPFALWVSFAEPHNPYQVPAPYFDMFPPDAVPDRKVGPEVLAAKGFKWQWLQQLEESTYPGYDKNWRRTRSNYLGMLRLIDAQVGRLVRHLESTGKIQNTLLVYLADHGDFFCDYGLMRKGVGLPEALTRIPMVWSGYGVRPQAGHPAFVSTADVFPTLCEALHVPLPPGTQGRSLWPLLRGEKYPRAEFDSIYAEVGFGGQDYGPGDTIDPTWGRIKGAPGAIPTFDELNPVTQSGSMKMLRQGRWKLTFDTAGNGELYDLESDPYELKNLYGDPAQRERRAELMALLLRWTIRTQDDLPAGAYPEKRPPHNWYAPDGTDRR